MSHPHVGCAGWTIPKQYTGRFPEEGSHLARSAQRLRAVEVNSCFYRSHRPSTYARWARETPEDFAFSLKIPREITHERRLVAIDEPLGRFLEETAELETKRGPILVQLPPSLVFNSRIVGEFLTGLRRRYNGDVACEPRHASWFAAEPERLLTEFHVARVAADPAVVPKAAEPGGWTGLVYLRLHGSPQMYCSAYTAERLLAVARSLAEVCGDTETWCIFDNTTLGAATGDALAVVDELEIGSLARYSR
jgi:uncharacterized protein YecE (DUF72 family)